MGVLAALGRIAKSKPRHFRAAAARPQGAVHTGNGTLREYLVLADYGVIAGRAFAMNKYFIPGAFFALGLAIRIRLAWQRTRGVPVPILSRILAAFALSVGAFLLALAIMTG